MSRHDQHLRPTDFWPTTFTQTNLILDGLVSAETTDPNPIAGLTDDAYDVLGSLTANAA